MGLFEDAVIFAAQKHNGKFRKANHAPALLHSMEVAHIISTMTSDVNVMVAGLLHDVVEDTDGTLDEIRERFGDRVAELVDSETENRYEGEDKTLSWEKRKEESIKKLKLLNDRDAEILWLADKLSNIRSLADAYSEQGEKVWEIFHQKDPKKHQWYYKTIAEALEMHLNRTGVFKEYIRHINSIWPGTFASAKADYKKYKEVSIDGCKLIGRGSKSEVYRYDDELVIKLYNEENQYKDIERENTLARLAFVAGIPTAIPFGIVKVGNRYGTMFELLESKTVSSLIAANPTDMGIYAKAMADIAKTIHGIRVDKADMILPNYMDEVRSWINSGIAKEDEELADTITAMVDALPVGKSMIHGDFHTSNVVLNHGEYMLIDMDGLSICHPIVELAGMYMSYIGFWEIEKPLVKRFMDFDESVGEAFFYEFMKSYLGTDDTSAVVKKAALLCYVRLVKKCYKKGANLSTDEQAARDHYMDKIRTLLETTKSLDF